MSDVPHDAEPVILINVYRCQPDKLEALMEYLTSLLRAQRELNGYISATLHRGVGGKVAAVHSLWRSREDWKAMSRHPSIVIRMEPIMAIATFEPHLYEPGEVFE